MIDQQIKKFIPKKYILFFCLLFLIFVNLLAYGSEYSLEFVSWFINSPPSYLEVRGNILYISSNAFIIVDISDETNPKIVSQLRPLEPGIPRSFIIKNNYAYVYWTQQGLRIIDISEKNNPTIISTFSSTYEYKELHLSYPYLYCFAEIANKQYYLHIFDVSNPDAPAPIGEFDLAELGIPAQPRFPHKLIINGNYVYFTSAPPVKYPGKKNAQLHVIDVSSPIKPFHLKTINLGEADMAISSLNLDIKDNYVYVSGAFIADRQTLKIINFSDFDNPIISGWFERFIPIDINISDNYAYITDDAGGIHTSDISIPTNPTTCGYVRLPIPDTIPDEFNVKVTGDRAYMYYYDNYAVYTIDVSNPDVPSVIENARVEVGHCLTDVCASDSHAYASIWDWKQFYVVDVNTPGSPVIVNRSEISAGFAWGIDVKGNYAYLSLGATAAPEISPGGLLIFDISNPETPVKSGFIANSDTNQEVQVFVDTTEMYAYLVSGKPFISAAGSMQSKHPCLRIVDVSDPNNPAELGKISFDDTTYQAQSVSKAGNYAYVAASVGGLFVIDVSDPQNLSIVSQWNPADRKASAVFVNNNYAYVAYGQGLVVLDVEDPASPSKITNYDFGSACHDVFVQNKYAFVVTDNALYVLDINDPTNSIEVSSQVDVFCTPPIHLDINGSYIYVACDGGAVYTFKFGEMPVKVDQLEKNVPLSFSLKQNYPNPFNSKTDIRYQLSMVSYVELAIYNLSGEKIRSLENSEKGAGNYSVIWKGKDDFGNLVSSGVYFYQLKVDGEFLITKKLLLLK